MHTAEIIDVALRAGEILLRSEAEVYRVEDTIARICRSYGISSECFALPTGMFISVTGPDNETVTRITRIRDRTVDLSRVEKINTFSRSLEGSPMGYGEAIAELEKIRNAPRYKLLPRLLAAGMTAFAYTALFNGSVREGFIALSISMAAYSFKEYIQKKKLFLFLTYFVSGLLTGFLCFAAIKLFHGLDIYRITIGSVMIFLPGITITNGIRDALYGDMVTSLSRLGEAAYVITAVGAGVGIAVSLGVRAF